MLLYILVYYYYVIIILQKPVQQGGSGWEGKWEGSGRSGVTGNCNEEVLNEKKLIFNKRQKEKKRKRFCVFFS